MICFCSELNSSDILMSKRHSLEGFYRAQYWSWNEMQIDKPWMSGINQTCNLPHQSEPHPSSVRVRKQTMIAGRVIFPSSPPPPSFISQPVFLSLMVAFDLLHPSRASSFKMAATKDYSAFCVHKIRLHCALCFGWLTACVYVVVTTKKSPKFGFLSEESVSSEIKSLILDFL